MDRLWCSKEHGGGLLAAHSTDLVLVHSKHSLSTTSLISNQKPLPMRLSLEKERWSHLDRHGLVR